MSCVFSSIDEAPSPLTIPHGAQEYLVHTHNSYIQAEENSLLCRRMSARLVPPSWTMVTKFFKRSMTDHCQKKGQSLHLWQIKMGLWSFENLQVPVEHCVLQVWGKLRRLESVTVGRTMTSNGRLDLLCFSLSLGTALAYHKLLHLCNIFTLPFSILRWICTWSKEKPHKAQSHDKRIVSSSPLIFSLTIYNVSICKCLCGITLCSPVLGKQQLSQVAARLYYGSKYWLPGLSMIIVNSYHY